MSIEQKLRQITDHRIQRGSMSIKLLHKLTGISQAHLSNFLHGKRHISTEAADRILAAQGMCIELCPIEPRQQGK